MPKEFQLEQFNEYKKLQARKNQAAAQEEAKVQAVPPSYEEALGVETAEGEILALLMQPRALGYEVGTIYSKIEENIGRVSPQLINKLRHYLEMEIIKNVNKQLKDLNLKYDASKVTSRFAVPYFAHYLVHSLSEGNGYVRSMAAVYKADPSESELAALLDQISHEGGGLLNPEARNNMKAMRASLERQ